MKYIDAEKLLIKIKRLQCEQGFEDGEAERGYQIAIKNILDIIDSLQQEQPEVDLEKEIDRFWDSCIKHKNEIGGNVIWSNKIEIEVLASHFFELGLIARKEN